MAFHTPQKKLTLPLISLCNKPVEHVHEFNFLGIVLNENVNWKSHTSLISHKISKTIGIMHRLKHNLPQHILKTIYHSLIHSYLNYGILCWGWNKKRIAVLQKKAIRVVTNSTYKTHTEPLFKKLRILKFEDIITTKLYKFYYRYAANSLPYYFLESSYIEKLVHRYETRNDLIKIPLISHKYAENCVRYRLALLLNQNNKTILEKVNTHSEFGFAMYLKNYYINNYSEVCSVPECSVCGRTSF